MDEKNAGHGRDFAFVFTCGHEQYHSSVEVRENINEVEKLTTHVGDTYAVMQMRCPSCTKQFPPERDAPGSLLRPVKITNSEKAKLESEMVLMGMPWVKFQEDTNLA